MSRTTSPKKERAEALATFLAMVIVLPLMFSSFQKLYKDDNSGFIVSGPSMNPTLRDGQYLIMDTTLESYARGDIVVAQMPEAGLKYSAAPEARLIVKRVIGCPGNTVDIREDDVILIDGEAIDEPYLTESAKNETYVENLPTHYELDKGQYFLLGDNRGNSCDSRYFGAVDREDISGVLKMETAEPLYQEKELGKVLLYGIGGLFLIEKFLTLLLCKLFKA